MKITKRVSSLVLGHVKGERPMRLICQSLFNHYHVEAWGCTAGYGDTVATYALLTETRLTKAKLEQLRTFVQGMLAGLSAAGMI